jgi:hypothetical protein
VAAGDPDIALFESNDVLLEMQQGIYVDGVTVSTAFITGGGISLDGIHPTPRGYSVTANGIIEVINNSFNSSIPPSVVNNFTAVVLP